MFGDESQNGVKLLTSLKIAIVDPKIGENELFNWLNKKSKEESAIFNISLLNSFDDLYKAISQDLYDTTKSLLNMQWIDLVYNTRPSVIIIYYYIKEGSTKEDEEINISKILDKIKSYDLNIPIYLFIISPPLEIDKYQHLKDDDKSVNSLRKKLKKDNYYIFSSKEISKTIEIKKLYENLIFYSRNYYKQIKNVLKFKRQECQYKEEHAKYTIMIAILSILKSKRKNVGYSKYLKEAYDILVGQTFNFKNYYYGNIDNEWHNYFEVKAIADWLLFKLIKINNKKEGEINPPNKKKQKIIIDKTKNLDIQTKIDIFITHIKHFTSHYNGKKDDSRFFYDLFWKYKRYKNLEEFCDKYFNELKNDKKYLLKISQIKFNILYTFIKLTKFYQKYYMNLDLNKIILDSKEIPLSSISLVYNPFYGKPPIYAYPIPNSEEKNNIGYNDDIFLKLTITKNNLTLDRLDETLKKELIKNIIKFYNKESIVLKGFEVSNLYVSDEIEMIGLQLYLNLLRFYINYPNKKDEKNLLQYIDEKDIIFELYQIFEKSLNIRKFPKIYIRFLSKNVDFYMYQTKNQNEKVKFDNFKKTILFKSLSILASIKLLSEQEQDILNELLNDSEFIPSKYKKKAKISSVSLEIKEFFLLGEEETKDKEKKQKKEKVNTEENQTKNYITKYIKENDILISLIHDNKLYNNLEKEKGILFEYNIKDIDKSQNRKILDLVEYEFKISTKLSKLKLKFENIKIFFIYTNQGSHKRYKAEIIMKEFTSEYLSNIELTSETPIILEHKIFLKYRKGEIRVNKILATLSQKKEIIYSIDIPNDIKKVIFIKDESTNVLKFDYNKNFKVGKNQYNPFELYIFKEKNDEVEIKDLKINFEMLPTFEIKEQSSVINLGNKQKQNLDKKEIEKNKMTKTVLVLNQGKKGQNKKEETSNDLELKENPSEKRMSNEVNWKPNKNPSMSTIDFIPLNEFKNFKTNADKKSLKNAIRGNKEEKQSQKQYNIPPEFYKYNESEDKLEKYIEKMEISYNNFESLLNQSKNNYTTLIRFLTEGSYKIMFSVIYFIRHKEIEEYIEYREESLLEFKVVAPFIMTNEINSNNFFNLIEKKSDLKQINPEDLKRYYLINSKIGIDFTLTNRINKNIKIKDVQFISSQPKDNSLKYITSYINDLISSYDLEEEEKKEILIIKKASSYTFPFEIEFEQPYKGSIGKINLIWSTDDLDNFEKGKLNILNKEEYDFPDIEVKPMEFVYKYETHKNDNDEIELELSVKNVSNQSKQITVSILNYNEIYDKEFIMIGIDKQSHIITMNEEIKCNYTLIPIGKGEFDYPCFQISEFDLITSERKSINFLYSENIAII